MQKYFLWRGIIGALVFAQLFSFVFVGNALAGTPTEELKATIERAQTILADPTLSEAVKRERVKKVAYELFDFSEMSKRVLARHWSKTTAAEQKEFVDMFVELLARVYFNRIKLIQDAIFSYTGEQTESDFVVVRSKAATAKGETFEIEYRLRLVNGTWKIYDIGVEGISFVANYRTQFNQILTKSTFEELLQRMREKTQ